MAVKHIGDPTYVTSRLALKCAADLFIGFTFFKVKTTTMGDPGTAVLHQVQTFRAANSLRDDASLAWFVPMAGGLPGA